MTWQESVAAATAVIQIPTTPGQPYYTQRTKLDGREFNLRFSYNQREDRWYLDILDENEDLLRAGIKLVTNWPLLRYYHWDPRMPPGELVAQTLTTDEDPPGLNDLGTDKRVQLTYYATSDQ